MLDELVSKTLGEEVGGLNELSREKRFKPYNALVDCMEKLSEPALGIKFTEEEAARGRLFYTWLKVVDDEIDLAETREGGDLVRKDYLNSLRRGKEKTSLTKPADYMTQTIYELGRKSETYELNLLLLFKANSEEGDARTLREHIQNRVEVGICCADTSIDIVRPSLFETHPKKVDIYRAGMICANLFDSLADYKQDKAQGDLSFKTGTFDKPRLFLSTLKYTVPLLLKNPGLIKHLPKAIESLK